jgi:spore coat protein A, manganese oxidase
MIKKKPLLFVLFLALCVFVSLGANAFAGQSPQIPLAGSAIPQFVQELPTLQTNAQSVPKIGTVFGNQGLKIRMCEFWANVLPPGTLAPGAQPKTRVWGYIVGDQCPANGPNDPAQDTYTGPVIVNNRAIWDPTNSAAFVPSPTSITFINELGNADLTKIGQQGYTQVLAWLYATDQTLDWADPLNNEQNLCKDTGGVPANGSPCAQNYAGPIPAVPHLHGGEVPPQLDGGPDAWFTSDGSIKGHGYYSFTGAPLNGAIYNYPNTQEPGPVWFHDHLLGGTRLNVYMGLAGAYYIQDPTMNLPASLHPLTEVVPVVLQDRMFDTNGQLFFPSDSGGGVLWTPNPEHPYWVPEFVGDTIVVNGKAWPYLKVDPKRYRLLFVNGSNARTYEMSLINQATGAIGPPMWVIGTDGGYLDAPVKIDPALGQKLLMMPGERYEVIIDFAGFATQNLIIHNTGRTPYPKGAPPQGSTLGRIMQFRVGPGPVADNGYNPAAVPVVPLRTGTQVINRLVNPATGALAAGVTAAKTRQLTLNEVLLPPKTVPDPVVTGGPMTAYPGGPVEILVNNTAYNGKSPRTSVLGVIDYTPITVPGFVNSETWYYELSREGDTEVWEIVNLTADAHPIHLHLVQFQVLSRQNFNVSKYTKAYAAAFPAVTTDPKFAQCTGAVYCPGFGPPLNYITGNTRALGGNPDITPYLQGMVMPPLPQEAGWKDTVVAYPGQVTRLAVRWAPTSLPTTTAAANLYFPMDPWGTNYGDGSAPPVQHGYVWHCHIVDHEDNEMMRPNLVPLNPVAPVPINRPLKIGVDY